MVGPDTVSLWKLVLGDKHVVAAEGRAERPGTGDGAPCPEGLAAINRGADFGSDRSRGHDSARGTDPRYVLHSRGPVRPGEGRITGTRGAEPRSTLGGLS